MLFKFELLHSDVRIRSIAFSIPPCLPIRLSTYLPIYPSTCLPIYLSTCRPCVCSFSLKKLGFNLGSLINSFHFLLHFRKSVRYETNTRSVPGLFRNGRFSRRGKENYRGRERERERESELETERTSTCLLIQINMPPYAVTPKLCPHGQTSRS